MQSLTDVAHMLQRMQISIASLMQGINLHVGEFKMSSKGEDFGGWLLCDGRSLSRTKYSTLYNAIGIRFGSNDDETFKLPDFRGRVIGGVGSGYNLTTRRYGETDGRETVTLSPHTHTGSVSSAGSHAHLLNELGAGQNYGFVKSDDSSALDVTISESGLHTHTLTVNSAGEQTISVMQPTVFAVNVFMFGGMV